MNYQHSQPRSLSPSTPLEYRKEFFRKPIILITAIIYTVLTILGLVQTTMPNLLISTEQIELLLGTQFTPYITMSNIIGTTITALITLAIWIIYVKSNNNNPTSSPSTGFTILYIMSLIYVIYAVLAFLSIIAIVVMFFIIGPDVIANELYKINPSLFGDNDITTFISITTIVVLIIVALLILLYPIATFKFISSIKGKSKYSHLPIKGCMLLAILNIPIAISTISSIFSYPTLNTTLLNETVINENLILFEKMNYFPMIYIGLCALLSIIMIIVPLSYRSFAKRANYNLSNRVPYSSHYSKLG